MVCLWIAGCQPAGNLVAEVDQGVTVIEAPLRIAFEIEDSSESALIRSLGTPGFGSQIGDFRKAGFYLQIHGDQVTAILPHYAGKQLFPDVYQKPEITIENKFLENLEYKRYKDPREFTLQFDVWNLTERLRFELHVLPDQTAYMNVRSAQRRMITGYRGKVSSLLL